MKFYVVLLIFALHSIVKAQYKGTAAVTQGKAITTTANLLNCTGGRTAATGVIKAVDNSEWIVPAMTHYSNPGFPFSSDLHNTCNGSGYQTTAEALKHLSDSDIIEIDKNGEVITAFVFADNYFEMYVNGNPVGKDRVPFTPFNSSIIRFKVKRPFTVALLLVDWEENLGLGSELNGGFAYHPGDGGVVAVFTNVENEIIAVTNKKWKAQTFYTSPITDLTCPSESGATRLSDKCSTLNSNDGNLYYGLHWKRPDNVMSPAFDDSEWPFANEYSNEIVGINNKPAYTNFTDLFDNTAMDGQFIWSTNLVLDNEVVVRYTLPAISTADEYEDNGLPFMIDPNPVDDNIFIAVLNDGIKDKVNEISLYNAWGNQVFSMDKYSESMDINQFPRGLYFLSIKYDNRFFIKKIIKQ